MDFFEKHNAFCKKRIAARGTLLVVLLSAAVLAYVATAEEDNRKTEIDVNLYLDGQFNKVTTKAATVAELLAENGIYTRSGDLLTPGADTKLTGGMDIRLQRCFPVFLQVDRQSKKVYTTAGTVAELLAEQRVATDRDDRVCPGLFAPLSRGEKVQVVRVSVKHLQEECQVPFSTVSKRDATKPEGYRSVGEEGEAGILLRTYAVIYADGQEESRELLKEEYLQRPKDKVVIVGTKPVPVTVASRGETEGKVYEGTASWISDLLHGNKTAYGDVYNRDALTCAFPDKELSGKTLRVTYLKTGRSVVVTVNDYGPHIKGRIIDLSRAAAEAIGLKDAGIGRVRIEVLD